MPSGLPLSEAVRMKLLELPGWRLEYDRQATVAAHAITPPDGPEACGCAPCRNWAATRKRLLPPDFRRLLRKFGVPFDRECAVYHNGRLESGLHSYGGWYHLVGRLLYGERECSANALFGPFSVYFHSSPGLLPQAFAGQPVVELAFSAEVPWLSDVPEVADE